MQGSDKSSSMSRKKKRNGKWWH